MSRSSPRSALNELLTIMARLRAPDGCPWDREQDHRSLRYHAVEEVYELIDAIEAGDDQELEEELGDLLLQVVFHCQLAHERGAFDFDRVARRLVNKLIHRHPHVFGDAEARTAAAVWAQWDRLKQAEKKGTRHERASVLDGVPRQLPALLRAQKLWKKATRAGLAQLPEEVSARPTKARSRTVPRGRKSRVGAAESTNSGPRPRTRRELGKLLFTLAEQCQERGWSAEELLRQECKRRETAWRREERRQTRKR